jgi:VRR-NUC domain
MAAVTKLGHRIFRNNVGEGWVGKTQFVSRSSVVKVGPGDVVIRNARPLRSGLCVGSSDLIGWTTVMIQPEMVGSQAAIFTALEVKTGDLKTTREQEAFIQVVKKMGGIAAVVRSVDDVQGVLNGR